MKSIQQPAMQTQEPDWNQLYYRFGGTKFFPEPPVVRNHFDSVLITPGRGVIYLCIVLTIVSSLFFWWALRSVGEISIYMDTNMGKLMIVGLVGMPTGLIVMACRLAAGRREIHWQEHDGFLKFRYTSFLFSRVRENFVPKVDLQVTIVQGEDMKQQWEYRLMLSHTPSGRSILLSTHTIQKALVEAFEALKQTLADQAVDKTVSQGHAT